MEYYSYPEKDIWGSLLQRPLADSQDLETAVTEVFNAVRISGDEAVRASSLRFDGVIPEMLILEDDVLAERSRQLPGSLRVAIDLAYGNIRRFHEAQRTPAVHVETTQGVACWQEKKPVEKVGIYIPGGSAPLFSTVLMLALPAQIAGCTEIVLCSPPDATGSLHPAICYAALKCGVTRVCCVGGIQAIAGLTFGTASIPAVYKIFGPGNQYVTAAKQRATQFGIAIDMPAGPSEVLVVADDSANPAFVAADLISQAEHGPDSQVLLVTDVANLPGLVEKELAAQIKVLPRREIATIALSNSRCLLLRNESEIADFVNAYAPEHLIICHRQEKFLVDAIVNAGSVFLGNFTPESAGDYASGTNHTLPTNGFARQFSGVNLDSFMKSITYQRLSPEGLRSIGPAIEEMASAEGLEGHRNAVRLRLEAMKTEIQQTNPEE